MKHAPSAPAEAAAEPRIGIGESRWPPAVTIVAFMALNIVARIWLPSQSAVRVPWLLPAIEAALLIALVATDPASVAARARWLRRVALTLVAILVAAALWATVLLVYDLIKGLGVTQSPTTLGGKDYTKIDLGDGGPIDYVRTKDGVVFVITTSDASLAGQAAALMP